MILALIEHRRCPVDARVLIVVAGVIGSVACGSSMPTSPSMAGVPGTATGDGQASAPIAAASLPPAPLTPAAVAGAWKLFTVDGAPLPYVQAQDGDMKVELLSDTLALFADGTATDRTVGRFTAGPRVETNTTDGDGFFTIDGNKLYFGGKVLPRLGTVRGGLLVVPFQGVNWVYRKS
jgi:hypothetical protein